MTMVLKSFSLLFAIGLVAGCGSTPAPKVEKTHEDEHAEHGEGPHGGTIFDWGKYHAEFCMDHAKKEATIYILGADMNKAVPIAAENLKLSIKEPAFEVELKSMPLEGEGEGKSSRYVGTHANFSKEQEFAGTLVGTVGGKGLSADFTEEEHDHEHK